MSQVAGTLDGSHPPATTTVFFDLDDTLFDHTFSVRAGLASLAAPFPAFARLPLARLEELYATELEAQHVRVLAGELTPDQARRARFATLYRECRAGLGSVDDGDDAAFDLERVAETYRAAYLAARRPVPGALELLQTLRARAPRLCLGVITNNVVDEQLEKLRVLEMRPLIDVLVISEEVGVTKPDPAIFRVALARAGCDAPQAVMVGDSWTSDVLGAHAAGLRAVWLNRRDRPCPRPGACDTLASLEPVDETVARILAFATMGR
jgi:HAD superfamily hydrolase (TIGR01509 family)